MNLERPKTPQEKNDVLTEDKFSIKTRELFAKKKNIKSGHFQEK